MAFLTIRTPEGNRLRYELGESSVRIGRKRDNDLILKDPGVSRHEHARIERRKDGEYQIRVLSSKGLLHNGIPVEGVVRLSAGDSIQIGRTRILFGSLSDTPVRISDQPDTEDRHITAVSIDDIPGASTAPHGRDCAGCPFDVIMEANEALLIDSPLAEMFEKILDLSGRVAPFERGVLMTLEGDRLVEQVVRLPESEWSRGIELSKTITNRVVGQKEAILATDAMLDDRLNVGESVNAQGIRSLMCVPLWLNKEVIGLVYLDNREQAGLYNSESLRYLTILANVAAIRIEHKRYLEASTEAEFVRKELRRAAEIQTRLLPDKPPEILGYAAHAISDPCYSVGGDYFDYLPFPEGRCAFVVADVAGKGLSSALIMSSLHSSAQILSEFHLEPLEMAAHLNAWLLRHLPDNRFVTCFLGLLDPARHVLRYVNAGHTAPLIVRAGGAAEKLPVTGPPLGIVQEPGYRLLEAAMGPGEILVSYSDGVTEAENEDGEQFGLDRLEEILSVASLESPDRIVHEVREALARHLGELAAQDDTTLMVVKRLS